MAFHNCWGTRTYQGFTPNIFPCQLYFPGLEEVEVEYSETEEIMTETSDADGLTTLIMGVNLNLD